MIYQHWIGKLSIGVGKAEISEKEADLWLPEPAPPGVEMIGQDNWENETVFPGLLRARAKIGPFKSTLTLNAVYTGRIEYWQTKQ